MVVEVKQQHMSYKTNHEPNRCLQYSFEFWRHEKRIPDRALAWAETNRESNAVGSRLDTEMIELRLKGGAFQP